MQLNTLQINLKEGGARGEAGPEGSGDQDVFKTGICTRFSHILAAQQVERS